MRPMKKFSNLNELWDYCSKCLVCNSNRVVQLSIGPDTNVKLVEYKKYNNILNIDFDNYIEYEDDDLASEHIDDFFKYKIKRSNFLLRLDCSSNAASLISEDKIIIDSLINNIDNIYFYLFAQCKNCESYVNTSDIVCLENKNIDIDSIFIETEGFHILKENEGFYIFIDYTDPAYNTGVMYLNSIKKNNNSIIQQNMGVKLPIINFNYSNSSEVIKKINNILSFK